MPSNAVLSGLAILAAEPVLAVRDFEVHAVDVHKPASMLSFWSQQNEAAKETPVTRVVNLLKQMQGTLQQEMDEDKNLHKELMCWCNENKSEKGNSMGASESKISDLTASVKELTAKSETLTSEIKTLEEQVVTDKAGLAEGTALREKEKIEFKAMDSKSSQAIQSMTDAIAALERGGRGEMPAAALFSQLKSRVSLSLLALGSRGKDTPFNLDHESDLDRQMDQFLSAETPAGANVQKFLQQAPEPTPSEEPTAVPAAERSAADDALVRRGIAAASAFVQRKYGGEYSPQSGQIVGVLKQMKDEMTAELSEEEQKEREASGAFADMRKAKTSEIRSGEEQAETKEDRLAETVNDLAEAKEDLDKEGVVLTGTQEFSKNLKKTCDDAEANFVVRRKSRQDEIQAVSETIEILTEDAARDAMRGTYSFIQVQSSSKASIDKSRQTQALAVLRRAAVKYPGLALVADGVQLDTFGKVKKAINDMIAQLKVEQSDEVKKNDWCKAEIQSNEMAYQKLDVQKGDLVASINEMETTLANLNSEMKEGRETIAQLHQDLQRASEDRKKSNVDYQMMVEDQTMTVEVLIKASKKLSSFYNKEAALAQASLVQSQVHKSKAKRAALLEKSKQTPPKAQMEYKPSDGATGIIGMIEKLIGEAKNLVAEAKKAEAQAQTDYETIVGDTSDEVNAISQEITAKIEVKAATDKDKVAADGDLKDAMSELEDLFKYGKNLDQECSYITKNFDARQQARTEEISALQEAKGILSGALSDAA